MPKLKLLKYGFSKKGFTLIELVVTLAIVSIVIGLSLSALVYSSRGTKEASSVTSRDFEMMRVYSQMRTQLISLYKSPHFKKSFIEKNENEPKLDSIRFFTTSSAGGSGTVEAFYSIVKGENDEKYLAYYEYPMTRDMEKAEADGENKEEIPIVFSSRIKGMTISCESGGEQTKPWEKDEIPEIIKITLYYEIQKQEETFEFSVKPAIRMF